MAARGQSGEGAGAWKRNGPRQGHGASACTHGDAQRRSGGGRCGAAAARGPALVRLLLLYGLPRIRLSICALVQPNCRGSNEAQGWVSRIPMQLPQRQYAVACELEQLAVTASASPHN